MRSCAEVLRLLAQRTTFDDEAQDMTAFLIFNLRGIYRTIDNSAQVWDERNYWKKAERLRHQWRWCARAADQLEDLVRTNRWNEVPPALIDLLPHFGSITVSSITRNSDWWCGARRALLKADHG